MQQKKQQKQGKRQEWKDQMKESDRMLKGNVLLEKPQWVLMLTLAAEFLLLVVLHVLVNAFIRFCKGHLADCFSWSCLTTFYPALAPVYIFLIIVAIAVAILNVYRFRNAFRSLEAGQKGTSRLTTMEEIKEQYPAVAEIPEKNPDGSIKRIPGNGGLPVASKDGYMYLDESATNALILAITRAGKGEVFSLRMLDSYSRSEKQPSLIILDMKFDLRKMCTKAFQDRGYEVMSINLENPMRGVGYNPLYLITRYYQEGRDSDAELLCKAFAYPHFASAGGKSDDNSDFFLSNATSALVATIMAHTVDCLRQDKRENAKLAMQYLTKRQAYEQLTEEEKKKANQSYEELRKEKTFVQCVLEAKVIPDDVPFEVQETNARKNNMASVMNMFTNLAGETAGKNKTKLDEYFDLRGRFDRARAVYSSINVSGDKTKGSIFSQMLTKLSQYTFGGMEQLTRESTFSPEELGFGKKPIALFLQVPFYDRSKDAIAISMIDQLYQANARACVQSPSGKCARRIIFHLDEVAQFPPIEHLDSKLSICLGLNMVFNLIIQTDAQLTLKYGDAAKTIKGNCGNQIFLQTSEEETAKMFSSLLGSKTITNVNRVGTRFALNKSYTETVEERPLLNPRELMDLEEGENVVLRTMYRRDLEGNPVKPHPIFNSRKEGRAFLYRYQYLQDYFPDADTVSEESLHLPTLKAVRADEMMYNYDISFEAAQYAQLPKQIKEITKEIEQMERCRAPEDELDAEYEMRQQMEEKLQELAEKQWYQWDTKIMLSSMEKVSSTTSEKQFADFCRQLGERDIEFGQLLIRESTAGELLLQAVVSESISLKDKCDLLSWLTEKLKVG
jgi:type IV secretion system protein VirD4